MTDVLLPGWLVYIVGPIIIAWLLWLTRQAYQNEKAIAVNIATEGYVKEALSNIMSEITGLKKTVDDRFQTMKEDFDHQFDRVDDRLDKLMISK